MALIIKWSKEAEDTLRPRKRQTWIPLPNEVGTGRTMQAQPE